MDSEFLEDFELTPIDQATEELKRVDHLIFVSLKYTRTVDVFKSIFERIITTGDYMMEGLLEYANQNEKIDEIPVNVGLRCDAIREIFEGDQVIIDFIDFYQFVRRINRAEFTRANEFRRHVTMSVMDGEKTVDVKIETVTEYYKNLKEIFKYVQSMVDNTSDEEDI